MSDELWCLCGTDFPSWHLVASFFLFFFAVLCCIQTTFSIWVAQSVYNSTVCMVFSLQHRASDYPATFQVQLQCWFTLHTLHLSVSLCASETNIKAEPLGFLISLFTFSAKPCSLVYHSVWTPRVSRGRPLKHQMTLLLSDISFNYWFIMRPAGIRCSYINSFSPFSSLILLSCCIHSYGASILQGRQSKSMFFFYPTSLYFLFHRKQGCGVG